MNLRPVSAALALIAMCAIPLSAHADENLFGYVRGSETLPQGSYELYQFVTQRLSLIHI